MWLPVRITSCNALNVTHLVVRSIRKGLLCGSLGQMLAESSVAVESRTAFGVHLPVDCIRKCSLGHQSIDGRSRKSCVCVRV